MQQQVAYDSTNHPSTLSSKGHCVAASLWETTACLPHSPHLRIYWQREGGLREGGVVVHITHGGHQHHLTRPLQLPLPGAQPRHHLRGQA